MQGKEKEKSLRQGGANTIMVYVLLTKCMMCLSSLEAERDEMGQHRIGGPSTLLPKP